MHHLAAWVEVDKDDSLHVGPESQIPKRTSTTE